MTSKFSIENRELLQRISSGEAVVGIDFGNLIVRELAAFRLAAMDSEPDCKERKLFCSTDTTRMRKTISVSAGTEDAPLYRHAQQTVVEREPIAWLNDAYLARGVVDGEAGSEDAGPGYIPVYREAGAQPAPVVPDDVLDALQKVARIRLDLNDFDGDRRGIADCLCDAEEALIEVVNRRAAMLAAAPHDTPALNSVQSVVTVPGKWIPVRERMPEKNQSVLISVNFDSSLVEPLICSARYTGSTFRRGDATVKPGSGIEQATHWMPLPAAPQEVSDA